MIALSSSEFQKLAEQTEPTCISIYMPAEKAGAETRKNPIIFKNLIKEAADKIEQQNKLTSKLAEALQSAESYIENYDFWQHQDSGLAFFIDSEGIKYYRLPYSFTQQVEIGDRFYLKPLLPVITNNSKFYLLTLAQNQVRLFIGSHYSLNKLNLPESVPNNLEEALKYEDPERQIQYHSGDPGNSPVYHGQGAGNDDNNDEVRRFLQQVDRGLQEAFGKENTPLILAGVESLLSIYRETNSYNNLLEKGVTGNPENVATSDLHQQAWAVIEPHLTAARKQKLAEFQELSQTTDTASSQLEEIVAGAANGQVDTLFLLKDVQKFGKYDPQTSKVEVSNSDDEGIDLIDFTATKTYLQGGKVYILEAEEMPNDNFIAAIFRYPVYSATASK